MAFATSDLTPRQNLGIEEFIASQPLQSAFAPYLQPNFQWLASYLENPDTSSLYGRDSRAARGAAWQFLRYAADRRGGSEVGLWRSLVDSNSSGLVNLRAALGAEPTDWIHDWLVSVYTADAVPGVHPRFLQPSWNYRSLYPNLITIDGTAYGRYPLRTRTITDGAPISLTLAAGSAAYLRFGVAAGQRGEIRTTASGAGCRESGPARTLAVGEVITLTGAQVEVVCVEGGAEGAEFVYIPFYAEPSGSRSLSVRGSGIVEVASATSANVAPAVGPLRERTSAEVEATSREWEMRFRKQEQRELGGLVVGAAPTPTAPYSTSATTDSQLRIVLVRTR